MGVGGVIVYWGVSDVDVAVKRVILLGAIERTNVQDVGEGIRVAAVLDPFGNAFGLIENPHFKR
jgi:predicted enzyme related to lactoylglutathione lyase